MSLDLESVRGDFPYLDGSDGTREGRPPVYLDNAAMMQMPRPVIDALAKQQAHRHANVHRGIYALSEAATGAMEHARATIAHFIGAEPEEVVFTSGTTQSLNFVAQSLFLSGIVGEGDAVVVTQMEHHSNWLPWQRLCEWTGAELRVAPLGEDGRLDLAAFAGLLDARVKVVSFAAASNVLGVTNPVAEMTQRAHAVGAFVCVDAAQAMRRPVDVGQWGCDFLAFSGHKIGGPCGTGALCGRKELLEKLEPPFVGGGMVADYDGSAFRFEDVPTRWEAGTPNVDGAIGLAAAVEYLDGLGIDVVAKREAELMEEVRDVLADTPGARVLGPGTGEGGCLSFNLGKLGCFDVATLLNARGIAVRSGHHCALPLLHALGLDGAVRVSPAFYNSDAEVEAFARALREISRLA